MAHTLLIVLIYLAAVLVERKMKHNILYIFVVLEYLLQRLRQKNFRVILLVAMFALLHQQVKRCKRPSMSDGRNLLICVEISLTCYAKVGLVLFTTVYNSPDQRSEKSRVCQRLTELCSTLLPFQVSTAA